MLQGRIAISSLGVHLEVAEGAQPDPHPGDGAMPAVWLRMPSARVEQPGLCQPWLGLGQCSGHERACRSLLII